MYFQDCSIQAELDQMFNVVQHAAAMQCGAFIVLLPHQAREYHDRFVRLMGNDPELRSADS